MSPPAAGPVGRSSRSTKRSILEWIHATKTASPLGLQPRPVILALEQQPSQEVAPTRWGGQSVVADELRGAALAGRRTGAEEVARVRREPGHDRDRLVVQRIAESLRY